MSLFLETFGNIFTWRHSPRENLYLVSILLVQSPVFLEVTNFCRYKMQTSFVLLNCPKKKVIQIRSRYIILCHIGQTKLVLLNNLIDDL